MKLLLIAFMMLPLISKSQDILLIPKIPFDTIEAKFGYKAIIERPGAKKDLLYSEINEWLATNFNSAKSVIELSDKDAGKIIAKGVYNSFANYNYMGMRPVSYRLNFTLIFSIKDDKFRVTITDLAFTTDQEDTINVIGTIESKVKDLQLYNESKIAKNKQPGKLISKRIANFQIELLNGLDSFASTTIKKITNYISNTKKDDF
ncbi:MAG: DUF4468 domain-containing protein [Bacteroidota bacterium]